MRVRIRFIAADASMSIQQERYVYRRYLAGPGLRGGSEIGSFLWEGSIRSFIFGAAIIVFIVASLELAIVDIVMSATDPSEGPLCDQWDHLVIGIALLLFALICLAKTGHDLPADAESSACLTKSMHVVWLLFFAALLVHSAAKPISEQIKLPEECEVYQLLLGEARQSPVVSPAMWLPQYAGPAVPAHAPAGTRIAEWYSSFQDRARFFRKDVWLNVTCINQDTQRHLFGFDITSKLDFSCPPAQTTNIITNASFPASARPKYVALFKKSPEGQNASALVVLSEVDLRLYEGTQDSMMLIAGWTFFCLATLYVCCCNEGFQRRQLKKRLAQPPLLAIQIHPKSASQGA
eukprot:g52053.t1